MFRRFLVSCITVLLALALPASVLAQDYSFGVEKETVQVYWNEDGTLSLDYILVFNNQPGAHVIDFVDMGMPNNSFDMGTVSADVNGSSVSVDRGEYQGSGSGFAVVMGGRPSLREDVVRSMCGWGPSATCCTPTVRIIPLPAQSSRRPISAASTLQAAPI